MDPITLAVGGMLLGAAAQGVSTLIQSGQKSEKDKRDAAILKGQIENIEKLRAEGQLSTDQAVARLESAKNNASSAVRNAVDSQVKAATSKMEREFTRALDDQERQFDKYRGSLDDAGEQKREQTQKYLADYRKNMKQQMQGLTNAFTTRRLGGSGAMIAAAAQQREQQGKQEQAVLTEEQKYQEQLNKTLDNAFSEFASNRSNMSTAHEGMQAELGLKAGSILANELSGIEQGFASMKENRLMQGEQQSNQLQTQAWGLEAARQGLENSAADRDKNAFTNAFAQPMLGTLAQEASMLSAQSLGSLLGEKLLDKKNDKEKFVDNTMPSGSWSRPPSSNAGSSDLLSSGIV